MTEYILQELTTMISKSAAAKLSLEDFDYELPPELIAQEPTPAREESRLMIVDRATGNYAHMRFRDIAQLLSPGDVVVVNDTKVIPARIFAHRASGGSVKLLLLKPETGQPHLWQALVTPIKRLKPGETLHICTPSAQRSHKIVVQNIIHVNGHKRLLVDLGASDKIHSLLAEIGNAPLPPYIRRQSAEKTDRERVEDLDRYQTVFAQSPGAVAAPTAGLHFSEELISTLESSGIKFRKITLHVGPGTFKPISSSIEEHQIEPEEYSIPVETASAINRAKAERRRVMAIGTTTLRALETAGIAGEVIPIDKAITSLYIRPGFRFKIADALVTNFHLSMSSLLVLAAAFTGQDLIMHAYEEAIKERYRFFSYGDAMLVL